MPLAYETMGAFYNRSVVSNAVPLTWDELKKYISENITEDTVPVGLGLGNRYVTQAANIASLFLIQGGINAFSNMADTQAEKALSEYLSYSGNDAGSDNANHLIKLKDAMDRQGISSTDMFVRGKIGVIFGYPSLLREIEYSLKRASSDAVLEKKDLRSSEIPQTGVGKKLNLARYTYFALSKYAPNPAAATDFLVHLSSKESAQAYLEAFPHYLPARNDLVEERKDKTMNKNFPWVRYDSFIPAGDVSLVNFDRGLTSEFEAYFGNALDRSNPNAKAILSDTVKEMDCQKKHLIGQSGYDEACSGS
ncbi:MAG: extracellular solute-binding protein [Patescibacteria group bacterium]